MRHYIDADKLIAEIETRKNNNLISAAKCPTGYFSLVANEDIEILGIVNSLQQKQSEVEFEDIEALSQPSLPSNLDEAAEEYAYTNWESEDYHEGASEGLPFDPIGHTEKCFKAGAEWQREQYECIPTEESYMRGFAQGAKEERKDLIPLINRLCEAILFEWKDAADFARKTLTQIRDE